MANRIRLKRSSSDGAIPLVADLQTGELAVNSHNGRLFTKRDDGVVEEIVEIGASGPGIAQFETFEGDGIEDEFTLSFEVAQSKDILVTINGLLQIPGVHYIVTGTGNDTLDFTIPPPDESEVMVTYFGNTATVQGTTGGTGFTGSVGFTGSQGTQGDTGFTGSIGFTGSQGIQGDIGFTGSQGPPGPVDLQTAGVTSTGALRYAGTTRTNGQLYGGSSDPDSSTTARLNYGGDFYARNVYGIDDVLALSDVKLKEDISSIQNSLDKVRALRGVEYILKSSGKKSIGVIAQEVEKILPEVVGMTDDGTKAVAYGKMIALLIEAIKELSDKVENNGSSN